MKILILIALAVSLLSCSGRNTPSKTENILNSTLTGEIPSLDPAVAYDTISASVVYQTYETLYEYHYLKRPYTLVPLLAEDMPQIENNGKRYIIKLKKGVRYHDDKVFQGKPRYVVAKDFITQIKRIAFTPTQSNGYWIFNSKIKGLQEFRNKVGRDFNKFKTTEISGVSAPDNYTLVIDLIDPYPQMLFVLALTFTTPIPLEVVEAYDNNLSKNVVGTGPFKLTNYNYLSGVKLRRFEHYRRAFYPSQGDRLSHVNGLLKDAGKQIPFLDGINYSIHKEEQTRWLNFLAKKIDYLVVPKENYVSALNSSGDLSQELKDQKIKLQITPTLTYWWLSINMAHPLLGKNKNLRKAIAHAIDIDKYIRVFTSNIGQKANSLYPPGIPGYRPSQELPYEYDLNKAKKFLAEAGFPNGNGLPTLNYDLRGTNTNTRQQAEFIKSSLAQIGIKINVRMNTFPAFIKKREQGGFDLFQGGWAMDYPDSENILQLLRGTNIPPGPNAASYSNPQFDRFFDQLKTLPNDQKKFEIMNKMETLVNDDIPWIMLFYLRRYVLYHDHLKNFRHSDIINNSMKYLKIDLH